MSEAFTKPRLANLLDHFSIIEDPREPWRVAHPLAEVAADPDSEPYATRHGT
jgi:hypothetical protein